MRQQRRLYGAVYGEERIRERLLASQYLAQLQYSYEPLFTPSVLGQARNEIPPSHHGHVEEGVRRILQVGKKGIAREGLPELAVMPGPSGATAWSYPGTFNMDVEAVFFGRRAFVLDLAKGSKLE